MPKVSVIVPVYQCEDYLCACIDSVLAQRFRDFELILVDDGSPDGCGKIIDGYAGRDSRIVAVHQKNGGPSSARNTGLSRAKGEYVYFLDSDDMMDPELLETAVPCMDSGWDMTVFGFRTEPPLKGEDRKRMAYRVRRRTELVLDTDEKKYAFISGPFRRRAIRWEVWNRLFRRDLIEKWNIRFGEDRRVFAEDMYFTYFYMAHCSRILLLPDILYTYRRHDDSGSAQYRRHLMIYSSNRMTEAYYEHCGESEDCRYLYEHFLPLYYLLHKGAVRRLRRYQWANGLNMGEAEEILKNNITDYPVFYSRMTRMFSHPEVRKSYRKDRGPLLQLTDRLYTAELLRIPRTGAVRAVRKGMLRILRGAYMRRLGAMRRKKKKREETA
ncbi:MAG: glycosyltransferase [Clostridia bacterium]|nr:glycosyltransferase [Clostridia bacterium]